MSGSCPPRRSTTGWSTSAARTSDVDHRAGPGGETLREIEARGCAALADIASAGHGLAIAVSHGNLISAILRAADPSFGFEDWRALRNPDLFEITIAAGRPVAFARIA